MNTHLYISDVSSDIRFFLKIQYLLEHLKPFQSVNNCSESFCSRVEVEIKGEEDLIKLSKSQVMCCAVRFKQEQSGYVPRNE